MDRILNDLFGLDDLIAADAVTRSQPAEPSAETADSADETRRERRRQRKADPERRRRREDFVARYTTGDPAEGFTTAEAAAHLREMREEMSPAEFREALKRTMEHLRPDLRDDFIAFMRKYRTERPRATAAPAEGVTASSTEGGARASVDDSFGDLMTGLMSDAGDGQGVGIDELLDDLRQGGLRAPQPEPGQQPTEADFVALLNSPLARAVLGGVAAFGIQGMQADEGDVDYGTRTRGG